MDANLDHTHDMFGHVPAQTQCNWCDKVIPLVKAVVTTHQITFHITEVEHHCSEACALAAWRHRTGVDA